jgi:hypothetical protein
MTNENPIIIWSNFVDCHNMEDGVAEGSYLSLFFMKREGLVTFSSAYQILVSQSLQLLHV